MVGPGMAFTYWSALKEEDVAKVSGPYLITSGDVPFYACLVQCVQPWLLGGTGGALTQGGKPRCVVAE